MRIAVVIPVYCEKRHILNVLNSIGSEVSTIIVVDDRCPEQTGEHVSENCKDPRVQVIKHTTNQGVGGAVITGYRHCLSIEAIDVVVKMDGDEQMDPREIVHITAPIINGMADYVKANRFYARDGFSKMPPIRQIGNALFSFVSKASSGYWNLMDPTNGFTAIHTDSLRTLPLDKISRHYFFESDMLFRLYLQRAVVCEVPLAAIYGTETSYIRLKDIFWRFPVGYTRSFFKRIMYTYFLHDFNVASLELLVGILLFSFGMIFGLYHWSISLASGIPATTGTVMVAALPTILGFQLILSFISYDVFNIPKQVTRKLVNISAK